MSEIKIPFKKEMKQAVLENRKFCTSRTKQYGKVGDVFFVEKRKYRLTSISLSPMSYIIEELYQSEGFNTPDECQKYITEIVGLKYEWDRELFVHWFDEIKLIKPSDSINNLEGNRIRKCKMKCPKCGSINDVVIER